MGIPDQDIRCRPDPAATILLPAFPIDVEMFYNQQSVTIPNIPLTFDEVNDVQLLTVQSLVFSDDSGLFV